MNPMTNKEKIPNKIPETSSEQRSHESMGVQVWRRFKRHPGALVGAIALFLLVLSTILAPLSPYDPEHSDLSVRLNPPSLEHPFGTDGLGRDLLTRVLYGGRISLLVGVMVVIITLIIGVPVGAIAGYRQPSHADH
jgi:peptide/nickel transport system permease protein